MRGGWIVFAAARYSSRGRRKSPAPVFSVLGIATGVLALVIILSVMNGFQLSFIESILEMSSCHLRVDNLPPPQGAAGSAGAGAGAGAELERRILALPGVLSAVPFREVPCLVRGRAGEPRGAAARGLPPDALERDEGLKSRLTIESGAFDLRSPDSLVLGAELARHMGVRVGDRLTLLSIGGAGEGGAGALAAALGGGAGGDAGAEGSTFTVTGIFRCGFYEYDLGWAYLNLDRALALAGGGPSLGIKLKNRWHDSQALSQVRAILQDMGLAPPAPPAAPAAGALRVSSWRDYNRAFFSALRTEKLMMFILVGLIFVVVALNIFQAQRRAVLERRDEIGLLRALGASDLSVRLIFAWDGFLIGLTGAGLGLLLGLLIASHIAGFFALLEGAVNFFIRLINLAAGLLGGGAGPAGDFAIFSTQIFYIKEIPSRVIPHEAALIFLFGLLSALVSAWRASGKISRTRPADVLRYE